jgi:hypothetical protein
VTWECAQRFKRDATCSPEFVRLRHGRLRPNQTRSVGADRLSAYCRGRTEAIAEHFVRFQKRFANVGVARCVATAARRNDSYRGFFRVRMIAALSSPPYTKIAAIEYR